VIQNACPGAGACGGMYTANTMSSAIEALGMSFLIVLLIQLKRRKKSKNVLMQEKPLESC
jgi:dihydroxyacid dehydratase/phosphogluconate dehydratase